MIAVVIVPTDNLISPAVKGHRNSRGKNCLSQECFCFSESGHFKKQEIWGLHCIYSWKDIHITLFQCHQYNHHSWSWQQSNAFCVVSPSGKPEFEAEAAKTKIKGTNLKPNSPFCSDIYNFSISGPRRWEKPLIFILPKFPLQLDLGYQMFGHILKLIIEERRRIGNRLQWTNQQTLWEMETLGGPLNECIRRNSANRAAFSHPLVRRRSLLGYEGHFILMHFPWIYPLISCLENWVQWHFD